MLIHDQRNVHTDGDSKVTYEEHSGNIVAAMMSYSKREGRGLSSHPYHNQRNE